MDNSKISAELKTESGSEFESGSESDIEESKLIADLKNVEYGCPHYKSRCELKSECCGEYFYCRFCHNKKKYENELDDKKKHEMDRFAVQTIKCTECQTVQSPSNICVKCNVVFAVYYCEKCKLYDDTDKGQYHCDGCGLCRIGGSVNMFHCDICNCCLNISLKENHTCTENKFKDNCPICLLDLHTSTNPVTLMKCSHGIHSECFMEFVQTDYRCPVCLKSLLPVNENMYFALLDNEIAHTIMPSELETITKIMCNDCLSESEVKFHIIGMKCINCKSYNTKRK